MAHMSSNSVTRRRLLDIKRGLGHDLPVPPELELVEGVPPGPPPPTVSCVNCGYNQHGQRVDRCSECGLLFASQMRDPTPWSLLPQWLAWWQTALSIWTWDRRIRIRTGLIPISAESASFAKRSVIVTAPWLGCAAGVFRHRTGSSAATALGSAFVYGVLGACAATFLMVIVRRGLKLALEGRWRRDLTFVPSSIDYATAWWPPLAMVGLVFSAIHRAAGPQTAIPLALLFTVAVALWVMWLWASITESENVRFVAVRVVAFLMVVILAGSWFSGAVSSSSRAIMMQLAAQAAPAKKSVTYAVVLNLTEAPLDQTVSSSLSRLGAKPENTAVLRGPEHTVEDLEKALATARSKLWPQDRFIFYINCRGALDQSGDIRMADDVLSSHRLAGLLGSTPTNQSLILIESEDGRTLLPDLRRACNAVVVTCPDVRGYRYTEGLKGFWEALAEATSDTDQDGQITVGEAFKSAFGPMILSMEKAVEQAALTRRKIAYAPPVFEVLGKAEQKGFRVPTPKAKDPLDGDPARTLTLPAAGSVEGEWKWDAETIWGSASDGRDEARLPFEPGTRK